MTFKDWIEEDWGFPGGSEDKEPACNVGDLTEVGSILPSRRSPEGGQGTPVQYSRLGNHMARGVWQLQSIELDTTEAT